METLSCHSNEITWAKAIKNKHFVEANVMNISAKFQFHAPYGFWFFNIFSQIYPFCCLGNQSNSAVWTKFICLVEDYSRNISEKLLSKYLQWDKNKGNKKHNFCWGSCYEHFYKVSASSPLWLLRRRFLNFFFCKFSISVAMETNQKSEIWTKFIWLVEDHSRNISVKLLSKYLQWDSNKCQFSFFPIISQWQLYVAIATRVLI